MALSVQTVHSRLQDAAKWFRLSRSARFLISGTALSLFFMVAFLIADARIHFGATGRWIGFLSMTSTLVGGLALALNAFRPRVSEAGMARRIERACSGARNVLINAVQFDSTLAANSPTTTARSTTRKSRLWLARQFFDLFAMLSRASPQGQRWSVHEIGTTSLDEPRFARPLNPRSSGYQFPRHPPNR